MGEKNNKFFNIFVLITLTLSVVLFITQIQKYKRYSYKENIINIVKANLVALNENYDNALKFEGVETKEYWRKNSEELIVNFSSKGYGVVPSSIYTGFYYTSLDKPIGFEGKTYPLAKHEKGWKWKEEVGDNWYYTQKIDEYWYYYEAGF